jgi:hypothetical protein
MQRKSLTKERKGVTDLPLFVIILFILVIGLLVAVFTLTPIRNVITETGLNDTQAAPSILTALDNVTLYSVQRAFIVIFAFLIIGVLGSSFLVRIHPVFIFMYIIFLLVSLFTAIPLSNTYARMIENESLGAVAATQPLMTFVMQNLFLITLAVGALGMIVIFAKPFPVGAGAGEDI